MTERHKSKSPDVRLLNRIEAAYQVDLLLRDIKTNQRRYATMTKNNVLEFAGRDAIPDPLTALLRSGPQLLINQAVEAELQELLSQHSGRRTEDGNAVVVRNGHLPERELQTGF